MDSQTAMLARTFKANPHAVCYTDPLWIMTTAFKTSLENK